MSGKSERVQNAQGESWYKDGVLHRDDGPAVTYNNGTEMWFQNGFYHRDGAPAIIYPDGGKCWYNRGHLHRSGGPAVEYSNGSIIWYKHGKVHRDDGPAVIGANGYMAWYTMGEKTTTIYPENGIPPELEINNTSTLLLPPAKNYEIKKEEKEEKEEKKDNVVKVEFSGVNRGPIYGYSSPTWRRYAVLIQKEDKTVVAKVICQTDIEEWEKETGNKIIRAFRIFGEVNPDKEKTEFSDEETI